MSKLTEQQAAAVHGVGNLLVVAGAGTGKTHTLIARCLRLLIAERSSLENILMVTFTEAAAAEMRGRLRTELQTLLAGTPDQEHLAQQLALLDTAHISTLHSFCLQLAREHFHELGFDPQFGVLEESQTRPLQREALDELLEKHYSGTGEESLAVQALIRAKGRGTDKPVRQLILKVHAYTQSLPAPDAWLDAQQARFEISEPDEWRGLWVDAVAAWRDEWKPLIAASADKTEALQLSLAALERLPTRPTPAQCAETLSLLSAADQDAHWPRGTKGRVRDPLETFFAAAEFLGTLAPGDAGDPLKQDWEWGRAQMLTLIGLVREFTTGFARKKRELGGVDFPDLEQGALRLLRNPAIAASWRARLHHIFVDEYQDINAAQDAILTKLSREGAAANRFLVGDVKQSIYRFRLANPHIFAGYSDRWSKPGPDGSRVPLTENFRSREGLLRFVNHLFAALMRQEIGGIPYEPLVFGAAGSRAALAAKTDSTPRVEFHLIARAGEERAEEAESETATPDGMDNLADLLAVEREARLVARRLRALHDQGEPVWDKDTGEFRPVQWRDMAVLLRSPTGRAETFAKEFSRAGVPLTAARDGFFASLEVCDLLNLLKLLDNPLQDVPLAAVLRSPLVGLSLAELAEIRAGSDARMFWTALQRWPREPRSNPTPTGAKVAVFLEQYARWRELVRQTSLSQCLETALAETHYEAMLLAGERGRERTANVRRLLDLARQFDPYQRQGLYRFLRFVQAQAEADLDLPPAAPPAENAVPLLSIHKSKGLEFPIVVLAGMGTRFNEQDLGGVVLLDERLGLCPKITPPELETSYPSLTHWLARQQERKELRGEELRLAYVALTRARDRLILVGSTPHSVEAARWTPTTPETISTAEVVAARSHLDWLLSWLSRVTAEGDWTDDRNGTNAWLHWQIHDPTAAIFAGPAGNEPRQSHADNLPLPAAPAGAREQLHARLNWPYPFPAATTEAAKTSVTALRRRASAEDALATEDWSRAASVFKPEPARAPQGKPAGNLTAAEIGLAHHLFLEHLALERTADETGLRAEAQRLQAAGVLAAGQIAALDFGALAKFWGSELGRRICRQSRYVHRELEFTARFGLAEMRAIARGPFELHPAGSPDEFVVVQGVADLVVLSPEEIWLVDFKTDAVPADELAVKVQHYEPQVHLYAVALARIYRRPVTECHLHFFAAARSVRVEIPRALMPG